MGSYTDGKGKTKSQGCSGCRRVRQCLGKCIGVCFCADFGGPDIAVAVNRTVLGVNHSPLTQDGAGRSIGNIDGNGTRHAIIAASCPGFGQGTGTTGPVDDLLVCIAVAGQVNGLALECIVAGCRQLIPPAGEVDDIVIGVAIEGFRDWGVVGSVVGYCRAARWVVLDDITGIQTGVSTKIEHTHVARGVEFDGAKQVGSGI